ncbi:hypothetical protein [Sphingobacterium mizutaii]|uniref:hypothetical protein n=1 Tax=Sphingobacterium mizutaii TaxID=1010 RepID=UPI00289CE885|nr:hypothetical protein [Sphingobacterium mizutaii]
MSSIWPTIPPTFSQYRQKQNLVPGIITWANSVPDFQMFCGTLHDRSQPPAPTGKGSRARCGKPKTDRKKYEPVIPGICRWNPEGPFMSCRWPSIRSGT